MVQKFNDSGAMSSFNEGAVMMFRIHEFQRILNFAWLSPLQFNAELGLYNFEVIKNNLDNLFRETYAKCAPLEKIEGETMMYELENFMEKNPIFSRIKDDSYGAQLRTSFNNKNWKLLKRLLQRFNFRVKEMMEKHGLSAPNADSPDTAAWS